MSSTTSEAVNAVMDVARRLGMGPCDPVLLDVSEHVVVRLAPLPLVARVRRSTGEASLRDLARAIAIAHHLALERAPAVRPAEIVDPGPHKAGRFAMSFWQHISHRAATDDADAILAARALRRVHDALATYPGALPPFADTIAGCHGLLADGARMPALGDADRRLLADVLDRLAGTLRSRGDPVSPIHGDAHLGNAFFTDEGVVWGDLEAACLGPREWDIACMPEETWPLFGDNDRALVRLLVDLRSVCVATWCWVDYGHNPKIDEAANWHLRRLRERYRGG